MEDRLWKKAAAAMERSSQKAAQFQQAMTERCLQPSEGDIYDIRTADDEDRESYFLWALIKRHPDSEEDLFYAIPTDCIAMGGTTDLRIPPSALFGAQTLRLGYGVWLPTEVLDLGEKVGFIEERFVDKANFIIHRLLHGEWVGFARERETEEDPEYQEWMKEVALVAGAMGQHRDEVLEKVCAEVPATHEDPGVQRLFSSIAISVQKIVAAAKAAVQDSEIQKARKSSPEERRHFFNRKPGEQQKVFGSAFGSALGHSGAVGRKWGESVGLIGAAVGAVMGELGFSKDSHETIWEENFLPVGAGPADSPDQTIHFKGKRPIDC